MGRMVRMVLQCASMCFDVLRCASCRLCSKEIKETKGPIAGLPAASPSTRPRAGWSSAVLRLESMETIRRRCNFWHTVFQLSMILLVESFHMFP